jgi:hypothetical protein
MSMTKKHEVAGQVVPVAIALIFFALIVFASVFAAFLVAINLPKQKFFKTLGETPIGVSQVASTNTMSSQEILSLQMSPGEGGDTRSVILLTFYEPHRSKCLFLTQGLQA